MRPMAPAHAPMPPAHAPVRTLLPFDPPRTHALPGAFAPVSRPPLIDARFCTSQASPPAARSRPRVTPLPVQGRLLASAPGPVFVDVPAEPQRHHVDARQRHVAGALSARDLRRRLRVPRLRQRRLDGHLSGQQRAQRLLQARDARCAMRSTGTIATARSPTSPRRPAWRRHASGWAWRSATTTTTAGPTSSSPPTATASSTATIGDGTFTDVTAEGRPRDARLDHQRRLVRLRQRRQARSLRLQLRRLRPTSSAVLRRQPARPPLLLHSAHSSSRPPASSSTTTATARSPRSARAPTSRASLGKALGVVATDINNDGLMDLFVANDTVQNFLFVNRGTGQVGRDGAAPPKWPSATAGSRDPGWAWTRPSLRQDG